MSPHGSGGRDDLGWADPELRRRLLADPFAVLADRGVNIPPGVPSPVVHEVARLTHLVWVDGRLTTVGQFHIDPSDEGLLFGRGAWESTRTVGGSPWLWDLHLDRLKQTCPLLDIDVDPARLPDGAQVTAFVRFLTSADVVVRVNVSAGRPGHRGMVWMTAALMPVTPATLRLKTAPNPVPKGLPYLTWKTFQYATRLRVGRAAHDDNFDSALLYDEHDNLLEAAHANLFLNFADGWATPATADGGLLINVSRGLHYATSGADFADAARAAAHAYAQQTAAFI